MMPAKVAKIAASLRTVGGVYEYLAAVFARQNGRPTMRGNLVHGVAELGFTLQHSNLGDGHYAVHARRGQVGVFRVDETNVVVWGWVETPNGRVDVRNWMDFHTALETVPR